jgi:L-ribulose-5-phosphate 3-epimerase
MKQNRRHFISTIAAAGVTIPFAGSLNTESLLPPENKYPLRIFTKPLDSFNFGFMCECVAKAGITGLDLTVRSGGKVEPAQVETKLPPLVEEAKKHDLALDMMVTGIVDAKDPLTDKVLKTASMAGIKHYRLGYMEYDFKAGIHESLKKYKPVFAEIEAMNRKYNIHGGYQNHAGTRVGGPVWDLSDLLQGLSPEYIGCQYDVRHAVVEGANSWILGMRLIAPYIKSLAIKDLTWVTTKGKPAAVTVPMGEGMVNWDLFFRTVKELNISVPMTLHIEYSLLTKEEEQLILAQQQEIIVRKLKKDVDFINGFINKYQLI